MDTFSEIEKEYLSIDPLNYNYLNAFYQKHKELLFRSLSVENSHQQSAFNILAEIACTDSFNGKHRDALILFNKIKPQIKITQQKDNLINQMNFCIAQSHFALKNYRLALQHFRKYEPTPYEKYSIDKMITVCKNKTASKTLLLLAVFGILLLGVKYSIYWFFNNSFSQGISLFGLIGAVLLIPYIVFINSKNK